MSEDDYIGAVYLYFDFTSFFEQNKSPNWLDYLFQANRSVYWKLGHSSVIALPTTERLPGMPLTLP